jgi:hypothetical protein
MLTTSEACAILNIRRQCFWQTWVKKYGLKPVREHGRMAWWSESQIAEIKRIRDESPKPHNAR